MVSSADGQLSERPEPGAPAFLGIRGLSGPAADALEGLPRSAWLVRRLAFQALWSGEAPGVEELAVAAGLSPSELAELLGTLAGAGVVELDGGRVVGVAGLTVVPTGHALVLDDLVLHTWCFLDAVGIPAALRVDAVTRSVCGFCHAPLEVVFVAGEPAGGTGAVTWVPRKSCSSVRSEFCPEANGFCTDDHLDARRAQAGGPAGDALSLAAATALGCDLWGDLRPSIPSL